MQTSKTTGTNRTQRPQSTSPTQPGYLEYFKESFKKCFTRLLHLEQQPFNLFENLNSMGKNLEDKFSNQQPLKSFEECLDRFNSHISLGKNQVKYKPEFIGNARAFLTATVKSKKLISDQDKETLVKICADIVALFTAEMIPDKKQNLMANYIKKTKDVFFEILQKGGDFTHFESTINEILVLCLGEYIQNELHKKIV